VTSDFVTLSLCPLILMASVFEVTTSDLPNKCGFAMCCTTGPAADVENFVLIRKFRMFFF